MSKNEEVCPEFPFWGASYPDACCVNEVADAIMNSILALSQKDATDVEEIKQRCFDLARKAEWSKFIDYYLTAFDIAMRHAEERNS